MIDQIKAEIEIAKLEIAKLICGNNPESIQTILDSFNKMVTIEFNKSANNPNFGAFTGGAIKFDVTNKGKIISKNTKITIGINYPPNPNTQSINGWKVDIRHELFHAFTKLMQTYYPKLENNKYYVPSGGTISIFDNHFKYEGVIKSSILLNELVTDLIAYICSYKSAEKIIHGTDLETINTRFGHYNGYFELLPLGLVFLQGFANYPVDYDYLVNQGYGIFDRKGKNGLYHNDLLYGILLDPLYIRTKLIDTLGEKDWEDFDKLSNEVLNNFQNKGRTIDNDSIKKIIILMKKYFQNKIENNNLTTNVIEDLIRQFNEHIDYAVKCYNIDINSKRI